jgi:phage tail sheath gpL-like
MASENISFDSIPASIRKPGKYLEFNTKLAVRTLPNNLQKMLIIAQKIAAGAVAQKIPTKIFSDAEAAAAFGAGSVAHLMARAAIKANPYLALTVVALDDAGTGVAAAGTVTITGPATSSGSLVVYVGAQRIEIGITNGQTAAQIAAALNTELGKHPDLPVTAAVADGVVTLTAKNKGTLGNGIGVYALASAAGATATATALTLGATDPTLADALATVLGEQYEIYAVPFVDATSYAALKTHLDNISGPMEQRPAIAVMGCVDALAAATTLGGALNHGRICLPYLRYTAASPARSLAYEIASAVAAVMAFEEDPARPLNTLALAGIAPAAVPDRLSRTEQESCLYNGVAPLEVSPDGGSVQIVRAISTYIQDPQGVPDISLLDITTIRTLDYVRKACRERIALRFPREKLSSKTPPKVRTELLDVLYKLQDLEIVEEVDANKDGLIVERDLQDPNRIDAKIPTDVVNGLHVFAGRIDLLL